MESKKINQLATELTPALSDLTIIGDPTTGISKKITLSQMASLFTGTVEEYANLAAFPLVGVADTIYIALDTNIIYRWNTGTSAYVELSPNIVTSLVFSDANGFDGTISLVGSTATLTITTALTQGSVPFIGTSGALSQDNANLFFDDTNNRLGINTNTPTTAIDAFGSGIIGRLNGTSTNNAFLGFASAGTNKWSIGNVQSDHRFRIYSEATTSELVSVLSTGEFGIGIANPTTKLHIDGGASALIANLDANVSVAKSISFRSDNSARINLEVSGTESGSNAGADFYIRRYSDAGALVDTPFYIKRSTGYIAIGNTTAESKFQIYGGQDLGTGVDGYGQFKIRNSDFGTRLSIHLRADDPNLNDIVQFKAFSNNGTISKFNFNGSIGISTVPTGFNARLALKMPNTTLWNGISIYSSADESQIYMGHNGTVGAIGTTYGASGSFTPLIFQTTETERMRISADGKIGIGTTTTDWPLVVKSDSSASAIKILGRSSNDSSLGFYSSDNSTLYAHFDVGTSYFQLHASNSQPIQFYTSGSEQMRIVNGGVLLNTTSVLTAGFLCISVPSNNYNAIVLRDSGTTYTSANYYQVFTNSTNTIAGSISHNTATTIGFNTSSDYRLKEDFKDFNGLDILSNIKFYDFKWKEENKRMHGVIAHELEPLLPLAVSGTKDAIDEEGNIVSQGVDYSKLVPILGKAIQELTERIKQLESK